MTDPPTYETANTKVWFLRTGPETAGEVHVQRVEYRPDSSFPPTHLHPAQDEHFEIESGQMLMVIDGEKQMLSAGEGIDVPSGTRHKMRNPSETEPAVVRWETRPALRTTQFNEAGSRLRGDILDRALFAHEFRDVFRLPGFQGLLIPLLAKLASRLGRRLPPTR